MVGGLRRRLISKLPDPGLLNGLKPIAPASKDMNHWQSVHDFQSDKTGHL